MPLPGGFQARFIVGTRSRIALFGSSRFWKQITNPRRFACWSNADGGAGTFGGKAARSDLTSF